MGYLDNLARHAATISPSEALELCDKAIGGLLRDREGIARSVTGRGAYRKEDLDAILICLIAMKNHHTGAPSRILMPWDGATRETG